MRHTLLDHVTRYELPIGRRCIYYGRVALLLMGSVVSTECHLCRGIWISRDTRESTQTMETTAANPEIRRNSWMWVRQSRVNLKEHKRSHNSYLEITKSIIITIYVICNKFFKNCTSHKKNFIHIFNLLNFTILVSLTILKKFFYFCIYFCFLFAFTLDAVMHLLKFCII